MLFESRIGEVCEKLQTGKTPPSKEKKYFNGTINWYTPTDLNKRLLKKSKRTISNLAYKDKKAIKYPKGTVLLSCIGDIAKVGITTDNESSSNQQITGLIPNLSKITTEYLYYWCREHKSLLESKATYVTIPMLNNKRLSKIKIFYEKDLIEQKKIANLLTQIEVIIVKREESIKLLNELLRSTFLDMFGDPFLNPKGWDKRKLGSIFKVKHGFAFKSEFFKEDGKYVLLTPGNFFENGGYKNRGKKQKYYLGEIPSDYILDKNDILIAMTEQAPGLLGSPLIVPESDNFLHNQRLGLICPNEPIQVDFLFHLFNQKSIRQIIHSKATGTKVRHTSPSKIEDIFIGYPPNPLQDKFATIVQQIESTKEKYQESLDKLNELFGSLSQKAFNGELDLSKMELSQKQVESLQKIIDSQKAYDEALETKVYESDFTNVETVSIQSIPKENLETYILDLIKLNTFAIENIQHLFETDFTYNDIKEKIFKMLEDGKIKQNFKEDYKEKKISYKIELVVN